MEAHATLYTLFETLNDAGKMTDGEYLSAMNALQQTYNVLSHPAPTAATGGGSAMVMPIEQQILAITPPELMAAWNRLFEKPLPFYRVSSLLYSAVEDPNWIRFYHMIMRLDAWAQVIRNTGTPASSVVDALGLPIPGHTHPSMVPLIKEIRQLRMYIFKEAMVNYYFCSDKAMCSSILTCDLFESSEKAADSVKAFNAAPSLIDAISLYLAQAWGSEKANLLVRHICVGRGLTKRYAVWSPPTTGFHRIQIAMEGMPAFEAYTPAIQLPRTNIVHRLRMLRFIYLSSKYGTKGTDPVEFSKEFVRHIQWRKDEESLDTNLSISGITAATRTQRRTYEVMVHSHSIGDRHFATITYLDPLSTGTV